ncbi:MAG: hypothetical protein R3B90_22120 [Planctomycetaceae bacterium]
MPDTPSASRSTAATFLAAVVANVWLLLFSAHFYQQRMPNTGVARMDLLANLPDLALANFHWTADSHWGNLAQRFDLVVCATLILSGAWGLGRVLLRMLGGRFAACSAEGLALAMGLGLSAWSLITLLLGVAGLLSQPLFVCLLMTLIIAGVWVGGEAPPTAVAGADDTRPTRRFGAAATVIVAPFVLAMLLGAMLPSTDFDVKEYHLAGPKEYYLLGRVQFLPHNVYTSFPFLTEMLSLSGMVTRGDWYRGALVGKVVLMSFAVWTACGVFALTCSLLATRTSPAAAPRPFGSISIRHAGWLAVVAWLTTPWTYRISIIAYTEGALACYVTLTTLALVLGRRDSLDGDEPPGDAATASPPQPRPAVTQTRWPLLVGMLAGSAASAKYPAVLTVVLPMGVASLWLQAGRVGSATVPRMLAAALAFTLGVVITFGPWLVKNTIETGNPVYPLLWSKLGGASFDAATNSRWERAHAAPAWLLEQPGRILPDAASRLWDVAVGSDWQSAMLFGLAPLSLLTFAAFRATRFVWLYLGWLFLTWCWATHRIDRFWVPMIPLLATVGGTGAGVLWERLKHWGQQSGTLGPPAMRFLGSLPVLLTIVFNLVFITTGLCGFSSYLLDGDKARAAATGGSVRTIQAARLGRAARVLFAGEAATFDADFDYLYNTTFDDSIFEQLCVINAPATNSPPRLKPAADIQSAFASERITHVCVNWKEVLRYRLPGSYGYANFVHPSRFEELIEAGVLERTPYLTPVEWKDVDEANQSLVREWAPELRTRRNGVDLLRAIELYRVVPP